MSTQQLDLSRSWGIVCRHRRLAALFAVVGLAGGLALALVFPAMPTGKALVVLPPPVANKKSGAPTQDIETQVLIANSAPVLVSAGQNVDPPLRAAEVKKRVRVIAVTQDIIEIRAKGTSAQQAKALANSVADTYVFYVTDSDAELPKDLGQKVGARVLERATTTSGGNAYLHFAIFGGLGAGATGIAGVLAILVVARGDRRLRLRDDIADAVGIPVLASMTTRTMTDVSSWAELFEQYRPSAVDAWNLRKTLRHLGLDSRGAGPVSVTVVSFAEDARALALGPQLAAFASSIGVNADLVVDTRHEAAASLAAADPAVLTVRNRPRLRTGGTGTVADQQPAARTGLRAYVVVVDRETPQVTGSYRADATVVAVSAGRVTAEELARVAVALADDARTVEGLVVADPDPTDRTTGRVPQSGRWASTPAPTALTDGSSGTRR